ncbi:DEAD/DEAH box helicase [Flagellatimonas centrodinii]|uniref:DEAD/DEAH box helicase n=1 Tax=Flagellatimonas centrodinii TaxID=2806210 RepID=UPI001FEF5C1B|nr:DEAD/DEAH box helicase [Flagellatimonas centrodinii]ULQ45232.1 DEAD/DEAH box helicase [Flagellatimonas centrodinii]
MTQPDHLSELRFDQLSLHPTLQTGLDRLGFTHCTPIQAACLPRALRGEDLAGQAQTGTGKSAAFLLATMNHLLQTPRKEGADSGSPRAIMLAPTRELAIQILKDAEGIGADSGLRLAVCYGGAGYETQREQLEAGVDILIGTPGRLIDFLKQGTYHLKDIEVLVLDEADRMFDLGFIDDIRYLLRRMPKAGLRRNYLFSATLSHRVLELAYEHMNSPQKIEIEPEQVTADRVRQTLIHVANDEKLPLLVGWLRQHEPFRTIVFVNTKRVAEEVERGLNANGLQSAVLSGDVAQTRRMTLLENFKQGELPILVATDVAARGLHIPSVSHVINYDLPQDAADYVHRIGRTARAGEAGDAVSLCCETWVYGLPAIEAYIGSRLPVQALDEAWLPADFIRPPRPPRPPRRPGSSSGPRRGGGGGGRRR